MACQQRRNSQAAAAGAGLDDADLCFSRYQYRCAKSRGEGRDGEASGACRRQTAEVTSSSNGLSSVAGGLAQNECAAEVSNFVPSVVGQFVGRTTTVLKIHGRARVWGGSRVRRVSPSAPKVPYVCQP